MARPGGGEIEADGHRQADLIATRELCRTDAEIDPIQHDLALGVGLLAADRDRRWMSKAAGKALQRELTRDFIAIAAQGFEGGRAIGGRGRAGSTQELAGGRHLVALRIAAAKARKIDGDLGTGSGGLAGSKLTLAWKLSNLAATGLPPCSNATANVLRARSTRHSIAAAGSDGSRSTKPTRPNQRCMRALHNEPGHNLHRRARQARP